MPDQEILTHIDAAGLAIVQVLLAVFMGVAALLSLFFAVAITVFIVFWTVLRVSVVFILNRKETRTVFTMLGGLQQ